MYFILSVESTIEMTGNKNLTEITKLNQVVLLFVWVTTVESVREKPSQMIMEEHLMLL